MAGIWGKPPREVEVWASARAGEAAAVGLGNLGTSTSAPGTGRRAPRTVDELRA